MTAWQIAGAVALMAVTGCADRMGDYPALLPTDQVLAEPALPDHARDAGGAAPPQMGRRGSGPAGRATAPLRDNADLARRADALRTRADALSRKSLDDCGPDGCATE